jgi:hypothetical protein
MLRSSVGVATKIGAGAGGGEGGGGARKFSFHSRDQPHTILEVKWSLSAGVRRPGNEGIHSPSSSTGVKNEWKYTLIPPHAFTVALRKILLSRNQQLRM